MAVAGKKLPDAAAATPAEESEFVEFLYRVTHDFSAPLRTVTEFSRLLQEDYAGKLDDTGRMYTNLIIQAGDKMRAMIEGLLVLSRLNTEPAQPETLSLAELAKEITATLPGKPMVKIGELPTLTADRHQMKLLLGALLDNATKYVAQGKKPEIALTSRTEGKNLVIDVTDKGIGIDPEYHADVFQVFRRLHKDSTYPGLGLGLTVAKKIAGMYGGSIAVQSDEGKGAIFSVTLPDRLRA